jgi:uncharacterized membrane protein
MNKNEFIKELRFLLSDFPKEEADDIIYDYEEHFRAGIEKGKTEAEISEALGDVRIIAKQYRASMKIEKAHSDRTVGNIFSAVTATVGLGFFNLVIVLGPFLAISGVIIGLFGTAVGISAGGLGVMAVSFGVSYMPIDIPVSVSFPVTFFLGLGMACFGILFFLGVFYISKFFYIGTVKYLRWNMDAIRATKGGGAR